jgi:uncharacterized glyoxalase superfamily protein PhnB
MVASIVEKPKAAVLFTEDVTSLAKFYRETFKLDYQGRDEESAYFKIGDDFYFILLSPKGSADLLAKDPEDPQIVTKGGSKGLLAVAVPNCDAAYEELKSKGVNFITPPTDRRWGLRTAHFADPEGNIWEINHPIEVKKEE